MCSLNESFAGTLAGASTGTEATTAAGRAASGETWLVPHPAWASKTAAADTAEKERKIRRIRVKDSGAKTAKLLILPKPRDAVYSENNIFLNWLRQD